MSECDLVEAAKKLNTLQPVLTRLKLWWAQFGHSQGTRLLSNRTPLFVRLPTDQAAALDRLADVTGRHKQHLISELLADRLTSGAGPVSVGRVEVAHTPTTLADEVLTLEEAAGLLKLSAETVRSRAEEGDLPGRRFGKEWRFARIAVLAWLADGDPQKRRRTSSTERP